MSRMRVFKTFGGLAILVALTAWAAALGGCAPTEAGCFGTATVQPVPPPQVRRAEPPRPSASPSERSVLLGKSVKGEELRMWVLGEGADVTFILGGIHGDEPSSAEVARRFLEHLRAHPELWKGKCVAILPRANPDGLAAGTRVNAHGVDVNRNFPASNWQNGGAKPVVGAAARYNGGGKPGAEPECQAVMQAVDTLRPRRIISIHAISGGRQCNNWDGPAEDLARRMAAKNGYPAKGSIGYPTPGSMGTWAGIDRKIPMITLELPDGASADECWNRNREALLEALR